MLTLIVDTPTPLSTLLPVIVIEVFVELLCAGTVIVAVGFTAS